ncbi:MAG TPA: cytochrome c oxidase subunit II, partial [Ramlibacter sp.]|nr:cytochrome c oxidase subunit II [Ramlibacter sp.]
MLAVATALLLGRAGSLALAQAQPRVVEVVAKKFVYVPDVIRVNRGETVILQFTAPEVTMGFSLPDFGVRADLVAGQVTRVEL